MRGEGVDPGVSANEYSCAHGAQINFGYLTPCLTYGPSQWAASCFAQLIVIGIVRRAVEARSVKETVVQAFFYHLFDCLKLNYRICVCEYLGRKKNFVYLMRNRSTWFV